MHAFFTYFWPHLVFAAALCVALAAASHAILYKRESRAAAMWVGLIMLLPLVGSWLYYVFGINRSRKRAALLRAGLAGEADSHRERSVGSRDVEMHLPPDGRHLVELFALMDRNCEFPLCAGNSVRPLQNGDEAYPEMLAAIRGAQRSVSLSTYIFNFDEVGREFVDCLASAVARGVEVRVIVDDAGSFYSFPRVVGKLHKRGVPIARFLPALLSWRRLSINLRNHRKVLIADGSVAFTGGMNISVGNKLTGNPRHPVQDLHFRIEGSVVAQLQEVFAQDWHYCSGETLEGEKWFPTSTVHGQVLARGVADGPEDARDCVRWALLGALACARRSVQIVTPYFLPDASLITALGVAAMRGVTVDIILPSKSNLPYMEWAMTAQLWQVLERHCRVHLTPPPFDHTKLMVVDGSWCLFGSANWDARSLRLNFELVAECYDLELARRMEELVRTKLTAARELTLAEVDARPLPIRFRDGIARLLTPYL